MAPRPSPLLFSLLLLLPLFSSPAAIGQSVPEYEVYAIEYISLPGLALSRFLPGADSSLTVDVSLMVWLIRDPDGRAVLVDTGYKPDAPNATNPAVEGYLRPDKAVAKLGISPEEISDIVLTHLQWDHVDGLSLFPNATIWVQREELEYYAARAWQEGGTVILTSDAVPLFANLESGVANATTFDAESDLAAYDRMRELASKPEWIIPGHDRAVFERFSSLGEGVARIR